MTFLEVLQSIVDTAKMARRRSWASGVVLSVDNTTGNLRCCHVAACELPPPRAVDFLASDWIVVEDYGRDIDCDPRPEPRAASFPVIDDTIMDIYSRPGTKVKFLGRNGYDFQLKDACKIFETGQILTVRDINVSEFSSTVVFEEYPERSFNVVMFGKVGKDD